MCVCGGGGGGEGGGRGEGLYKTASLNAVIPFTLDTA